MPNRILKESICTSDNVDALNPFQETVFYRLIVNCDDYGRMDARPKILASKLFPLRDIKVNQISDALTALSSANLVILYQVEGKPFLQMRTWDKHQRIRAKMSKYPGPDEAEPQDDNIRGHMSADDSKCQQDADICARNTIQSNTNPNPNPNTTAQKRERFERFWSVYPRKVAKTKAQSEFEKLNPDDDLTETIIKAVNLQAQSDQWQRDGGQYIPHPATWLHQRRWEDEITQTGGRPQNGYNKQVHAQQYSQRDYTEEQLAAASGGDDYILRLLEGKA